MQIICTICGNPTFFDCELETVLQVEINDQGILIGPAEAEGWHYAEESIRQQVQENVTATLRMHADELQIDYYSGSLYNPYLECSICYQSKVCRGMSDWQPPGNDLSLDEEMIKNRKDLNRLRKERRQRENRLPVLWQP